MSSSAPSLQTLRLQLEDSLVDARLSDEEKRALGDALRQARLPEDGLRQLRNQAFELARQHWSQQLEEAAAPEPLALVRWLEGVVRTLDLSRAAGGSYRSQAWFSPGDECRQAIEGQLRTCRAQADICVFTLSDDRISREVLAAHRRGVAVRLIADNDKALDRGSDVLSLRAAGVAVRVDETEAHMHHKFALFDRRWLLNGSYNWTRSASEQNEENLVLCNAPALVAAFSAQFEAMWSAFS